MTRPPDVRRDVGGRVIKAAVLFDRPSGRRPRAGAIFLCAARQVSLVEGVGTSTSPSLVIRALEGAETGSARWW